MTTDHNGEQRGRIGKVRSGPRLIAPKSLPENWRIVFNRDPVQFFDMVCFNFYLAGQFGNKIPVSEGRQAIKAWLEWHDKITGLVNSNAEAKISGANPPEVAPTKGTNNNE